MPDLDVEKYQDELNERARQVNQTYSDLKKVYSDPVRRAPKYKDSLRRETRQFLSTHDLQDVYFSQVMSEIATRARQMAREASILDYPHKTLDPALWEIKDNETAPRLHPKVREEILGRLYSGLQELDFVKSSEWIKSIIYIGSSTTAQYVKGESDLDITCVVDCAEFKVLEPTKKTEFLVDEEVLSGDEECALIIKKLGRVANEFLNEKPVFPGEVENPINYFFRGDITPVDSIDSCYNLREDTWFKSPEPVESIEEGSETYKDVWKKAEEYAQNVDLLLGESKRDVVDYSILVRTLEDADAGDRKKLLKKIKNKLQEIDGDVAGLVDIYEEIHEDRLNAFMTDLEEMGYKVKEKWSWG